MNPTTFDRLEINLELSHDDWQALMDAMMTRGKDGEEGGSFWTVSFIAFFAFAYFVTELGEPYQSALGFGVVGLITGAAGFFIWARRQAQANGPVDGGAYLRPARMVLSAEGIEVTEEDAYAKLGWSSVQAITLSHAQVFLWVDEAMAHQIPFRFLPEGTTSDDLIRAISQWTDLEVNPTSHAPTESGAQERVSPAAPELPDRPEITDEEAMAPGEPKVSRVVLAALAAFIVWTVVDRLSLPEGEVEFFVSGLPGLVWYTLPLLFAAFTLSLSDKAVTFKRALYYLLLTTPFVIVGFAVMHSLAPYSYHLVLSFSILIPAFLIATRLAARQWLWLPVIFVGLFYSAFAWVSERTYVDPTLWYAMPEQDEEGLSSWDQGEAVLFSQPERIGAAVEAMTIAESPATFFVGFAGYAEEKVFAEEIKFASTQLGRIFNVNNRNLLLLNDARDLDEHPIASSSSLVHGLKLIGEKMQKEEDLLILALSSHGSPGTLSVSNGYLPLVNLEAGAVRDALDSAGIKWRVIIVSACYAGSFVETLADPYTIIITAASPDRISFGCSNERDLTYFGEAFYRDAVTSNPTLFEAFESAKKSVTAREIAEGYEPSLPIAHFGEAIRQATPRWRTAETMQ